MYMKNCKILELIQYQHESYKQLPSKLLLINGIKCHKNLVKGSQFGELSLTIANSSWRVTAVEPNKHDLKFLLLDPLPPQKKW